MDAAVFQCVYYHYSDCILTFAWKSLLVHMLTNTLMYNLWGCTI